jgi:hypothetical protein
MALSFPVSPSIGDEFVGGGFTWIWTGSGWDKAAASSAGGGNGFYLYTGATGYSNFNLVGPQPAGTYFITSELSDTTYDVYAISSAGLTVGYTTTNRLVTTAEAVKVVVIGGTVADTLQFETKATTFSISSSDINDGAPAFITSVSVVELESFDDTTVITGGNFATDVEVYFVGTNAVDLAAKNLVRTSSSELIATRPDNLIPDHSPYDVKIINPGIQLPSQAPTQHILPASITAGTYPIWVTTSPMFWEQGSTTDITLVAGDVETSDIDYSIVAGALWSGFVLDGETGIITGDDSALVSGDQMTFTVRAVDTAGNTNDRSFDVWLNAVPVYSFYFDPFANAGKLDTVFLLDLNL